MTIRVPSAGDAPLSGSGQAGDLLVRVNVANSKLFRRQGSNLHHEARIPLHAALLGGRVRVPTLDGEVDVRVPGGTQQGEEMVLKGRGIQNVFGHNKGDLFVTFNVQIPRYELYPAWPAPIARAQFFRRSLTKRQREILQQYADDVEGRAPRASNGDGKANEQTTKSTSTPADPQDGSSANTNGTASSTFTYPPTHGSGWVSRTLHKLRELIGF